MSIKKLTKICQPIRITIGLVALIIEAFYSGNYWFYLGFIPLIIGFLNFCSIFLLTKKYDV